MGLRTMDRDAIVAAFDQQVRRNTEVLEPGVAELSALPGVVRELAVSGQGLSRIAWSELDEHTADEVIAAQVEFFRRRGEAFEWKLFGYDQPADLGERLLRAGFVADEEEVMLVAPTAAIAADVPPPDGIRLTWVTDRAGVEAAAAVHAELEPDGARRAEHVNRLLAGLADEREPMAIALALAGDEPVSSGRVDFGPGASFAGLYSGVTRPGWRGRGIYRAIVAYRARLAAARGFQYLRTETSTMSRPILRRLGFEPVATTTPHIWTPESHLKSGA
jgi:GNAT superfamily N-acetyltransferase